MVDGQAVDKANAYTLRSGSIIISFKKAYLDSLKTGEHEIAISTGKGNLNARIIIREDEVSANKPYENIESKNGAIQIKHVKSVNSPVNTGDSQNIIEFTLIMIIVSAALAALIIRVGRHE